MLLPSALARSSSTAATKSIWQAEAMPMPASRRRQSHPFSRMQAFFAETPALRVPRAGPARRTRLLQWFYNSGILTEIFPALIFIGVGP